MTLIPTRGPATERGVYGVPGKLEIFAPKEVFRLSIYRGEKIQRSEELSLMHQLSHPTHRHVKCPVAKFFILAGDDTYH